MVAFPINIIIIISELGIFQLQFHHNWLSPWIYGALIK